jgi:glucan 1,3-beta-glucosidase
MIRSITGTGAGNGPMITLHDGFQPQNSWVGFLPGADRLALDTHNYLCFSGFNSDPMPNQVVKVGWKFESRNDESTRLGLA